MPAYHIRPAIPADLDTLVRFTQAQALDAEGIDLPAESVRRGVQTGLQNPDIARYWLAVDESDRPVGAASVVREWSDWHGGWYWWVQSLYVDPAHRGRGVAGRLLEAIRAAAQEAAALDLRLYVHAENEVAIRAYRRYGFEHAPYRVMRIAGKRLGNPQVCA